MNRLIVLVPMVAAACSGAGTDDTFKPDDLAADADCSSIFQQSVLPEYHVTIAADEWAAMQDEFLHRVEREAMGLEIHPYHPVEVRYVADGESETPDVSVLFRLKGASSWLQTIQLDPEPKMQFVLAFNEVDPNGRFHGVRKVELDMPRIDRTFLHQRVALSMFREVGVPAQCANNAKLYINGELYGLYAHVERMDKEFLQRVYGKADADGDLWQSGRIIKTNEDTFKWDRLDAFWHMADFTAMDGLTDMEASFHEWAAEVVIGHADGYYNGRANFYLYDHPSRGFIWIPHDLDAAMDQDFLRADAPPIFPSCVARWERDWFHYMLTMADPAGTESYVDKIRDVRSMFDPAEVVRRIDLYSQQIAGAVEDDPRRPFTVDDHDLALSFMRDFAPARADYLDAWLACRDSGGADGDGDGSDMCHDCNDADATVHPGATETCNLRDDDCDGRVDTIDDVTVCEQ